MLASGSDDCTILLWKQDTLTSTTPVNVILNPLFVGEGKERWKVQCRLTGGHQSGMGNDL